ncbi:sulfotransferase [uncultured Draconibacterium sp.]|uniref:sulfotransferase family protein n=1 Tax=uncultured Draconibacterium sp. TaxID=1573823 RepID=UPI002AA7A4FC|nr:sulfotransferase [uncultured Draconibacterium sp.]
MAVKVDFIILGAAKAGTTTMADILSNHPAVNFCKEKEPNFFSTTDNWKANIEKYHCLYEEEKGKIYGEASHSYTALPLYNLNIWEDIYDYNSNMKFVYIVRNPIDRFISAYMQNYQRGRFDYSIDEAIHKSKNIHRSRYYTQILPFIEKFGRDNVMIIDFDDFIKDRKVVLEKLSDFLKLSLDKFDLDENKHSNVSVNSIKLNAKYDWIVKRFSVLTHLIPNKVKMAVKRMLVNKKRVFKEKPRLTKEQQETIIRLTRMDTLALSKLINKDLSGWLQTVDNNN